MELNIYSRASLYLEWTVERTGSNISDIFELVEREWQLEMHEIGDKAYEIMFFIRNMSPTAADKEFRVTLYWKTENKLEYIGCRTITSSPPYTEIFACKLQEGASELFDESRIDYFMTTFFVVFDACPRWSHMVQHTADQKRDWSLLVKHKSIQTPSYMNGQPCINRLSDDFKKLLEDESSNPDVLLACGDCSFPAHKNVLSSRSDVFKTMLQSDMMESSTGSVEIADIEPTTFKEFLGYIYTGKLPELTVELATELYEVGDKYAVDALKARCGDILKENVTLENACAFLILADRHSDPEFKEYVMRYIVKEEIPLVSEEWSDFCSGHPDLAIEILNRAYRSAKSSSRRRQNFRQNYRGFRGRGRGSYNRNFDKTNEQGDKMNVTGITS